MSKKVSDFRVLSNTRLKDEYYILELESTELLPDLHPGQFVQVLVNNAPGVFLRRPFSIHDVNTDRNSIRLLIQIVGNGSEALASLKPGEEVNLVYPLGNSFTMPQPDEKVLLIGGGCGVAPLLFLGKKLLANRNNPQFLMGFRNSDRIIEYSEYEAIGKVWLTTEDGSAGEKGFVTNHPVLETGNFSRIYCCGPDPMMKAVTRYARSKELFCEVSLENLMACGFGVCLCCVVNTVSGNLCSCIDGPVFNINDLKW
jgi:dihydroorotate dehydrogenase electron transfer subunit